MASMTMAAASFTAGGSFKPITAPRRAMSVVAKASSNEMKATESNKEEISSSNNGRRDLMFGAVAAAAYSIARVAMADEPKRGSPEAKKKYAPICVTMPTARICRN
ncbi:Photosystem II 5 kDa protein, chloroplastic [Linum perenne]